jgi:hypothetical protein
LIYLKAVHRDIASARRSGIQPWSTSVMDVVMLAIGLVFFALSIGYVYACDRL